MHRIKDLDRYAIALLLVLLAMAIVFAAVYVRVIFQNGFLYNDEILIPSTEGGNTVYTAKVGGEQWRFTVTPEKVVTFRCGDKQYGPYTAKIDPTAIPAEDDMAKYMTGVEVREGDEILFRGGIYDTGSFWIMVNEDGTSGPNVHIAATLSNGNVVGPNGEIIDPMEPSVYTILELMNGPKLSHKGHGVMWFAGLFISMIAASYILFADEIFRWHFVFRARNPELIEPSEWELTMRPISWTVMVICALVVYLQGLPIVV